MISIVVPVYNNEKTLERCLTSLLAQSYSDWEVLVVDDASSDSSLALARHWAVRDARIRVFARERQGGPAAARNLGLRESRGSTLAFIDGDSSAPEDWLERLKQGLDKGFDLVGGPDRVPPDEAVVSRCIGYSMDSRLTSAGLRRPESRLVRYLPGTGNLAFRREVLDKIGELNESFVDTGEDKEFLFRIHRAGCSIGYLPEAPVWHHRSARLGLHWRKLFTYGRRRVDIWFLHPAAFEPAHAIPGLLLLFSLMLTMWKPALCLGKLLPGVLGLLLLDGAWAARHLRDWRCAAIVPLTSLAIPLGYGAGTLCRLGERLASSWSIFDGAKQL